MNELIEIPWSSFSSHILIIPESYFQIETSLLRHLIDIEGQAFTHATSSTPFFT